MIIKDLSQNNERQTDCTLPSMSMKVRRRPREVGVSTIDGLDFVLVRPSDVEVALRLVTACKSCSDAAVTPFDYLLDALTLSDPSVTEYIMNEPVPCPACGQQIGEKTLVAVG